MARKPSPTDLKDAEDRELDALSSVPTAPGRPRAQPLRELLDASFCAVRSGRAWRLLPHEFPPWQTVYHSFRGGYGREPPSFGIREFVNIKTVVLHEAAGTAVRVEKTTAVPVD
jgi:transposase